MGAGPSSSETDRTWIFTSVVFGATRGTRRFLNY